MKFLQSTIQRSQKILQCIPIESTYDESCEECHIILIFRNYVQVLFVDNSHPSVNVSTQATYPLQVSIIFCYVVGERIAIVTSDAVLMMLDKNPPFTQIDESFVLSEDKSPSTIPIAYFAHSSYNEYVVLSGFTEKVVVVEFDSQDIPQKIKSMKLPDVMVHGLVATTYASSFIFLVSTRTMVKYLLTFDVETGEEIRRTRLEDNFFSIAAVFNYEGYCKTAIFANNMVHVLWDENKDTQHGPNVIEISNPVHSHFTTLSGELVIQLLNGDCYVFNEDFDDIVPKGKLPLISTFCCLPNNLLLCVSETSDSFFLPINFSSGAKLANPGIVGFDLLPRTSIPLTPRITYATFNDDSLIVSSGGNESKYIISKYKNTVPFIIHEFQEATQAFKNLGTFSNLIDVSLYFINDKSLIISSDKGSSCLIGDYQISNEKTIAFGKMGNEMVQIHQNGIKFLSGKSWTAPSSIQAAAICDKLCVISLFDDQVILFDSELNESGKRKIVAAHAFAFCGENNIAIASFPKFGNPTITLYTLDLKPTDFVGQLTSKAKSIVFQPQSMDIFVSTEKGDVYKWTLGNEFSNSYSYIFSGSLPPILYGFADYIMIISDKTYLFNGFGLLSLGIKTPKAICLSDKENEFFMLDNNNIISHVEINDYELDLSSKCAITECLPRKVVTTKTYIISIARKITPEDKSALLVMRDNNSDSLSLTNFFLDDLKISAISILSITEDLILVGFRKNITGNGLLQFFDVRNIDNIDIPSIEIKSPPYSLAKINDKILVGSGNHIYLLEKKGNEWIISKNPLTGVHTQIGFIEVSDKFIWVGDRTQSVFCFYYKYNNGEFEMGKYPVAIDPEPRQLTSMCLFNGNIVVVGDKFGQITLLKIPNELINPEYQWRHSSPPTRGYEYPPNISQLEKIASFSTCEAVTSLMKSPKENVIFYTTLLGQIGALILLNNDDYSLLSKVEIITQQKCFQEFGFTNTRKFDLEKLSIINGDFLEAIESLKPESQNEIGSFVGKNWQNILGLLCRIKQKTKF